MRWMAVVAILTVSLAGCSQETTEPLDADAPPAQPPGPAGNGTAPGLAALLGLDLPEDTTAPLAARFTVDAPGAAAPGNVSWSLTSTLDGTETLVDGGEGVPATANHTFGAGRHLLRLEVTEDGHSAVETVTLVVDAAREVVENATEGPGGATVVTLEGTMAANPDPQADAEVQSHALAVPAGVQAVTLWGRWDASTPAAAVGTPAASDLEVLLLDPSGAEVAAGTSFDFEYVHHAGPLAPGTYTLQVVGALVPAETPYAVDVLLWGRAPTVETRTGSLDPGANEGGQNVGAAPAHVPLQVPPDATAVAARLAWSSPVGDACTDEARANDLDLAGTNGAVSLASGGFLACEFGHATGAAGGDWTFTVTPYLSGPVDYTLTILHA